MNINSLLMTKNMLLTFGVIYDIIPIIEAYELFQSLLYLLPLSSILIVASALVGFGDPLQCSIPVSFNTLKINTG